MAAARMNIIGCGRAAGTLAAIWQRAGLCVAGEILNRTPESARNAVSFIGGGIAVSAMSKMSAAPFWMIGAGDDQIEPLARALADSDMLRAGDVVFHLSGALGAGQLAACRTAGAVCASVHPVHSFADPMKSRASFRGSRCVVEGDRAAVALLAPLIEGLGAVALQIDPEKKIVYHAGMVFASNYVVAVLADALAAIAAAGIAEQEAAALLGPLVRGSVENTLETGPVRALTGPIARGDIALVASQLEALERCLPDVARRYRELGLAASAIARQRPGTDSGLLDQIEDLLHRD